MAVKKSLLTKIHPFIGIGLFFSGLLLLRIVGLDNYPAPHPDEGFWSIGAKNFVLFGDALLDGRLHPFLSPVTFTVLSGYFSLFSPSLLSARVFSSIVGLITVIIVWLLGRKTFPERDWLFPFLFGVCSFYLLANRHIMIETQQVSWLTLAAYFWICSTKKGVVLAAIFLGIALLVKINAIYVFFAFLCSSYSRPIDQYVQANSLNVARFKEMGIFSMIVISVVAAGYFIAFRIDPDAFVTAYRFEIDGEHFLDANVLFHFLRFGLNPQRLLSFFISIIISMPIILVLSIIGLLSLYRKQKDRADILFGSWLIMGFLFFSGQIFSPPRYLLTAFLAFSYFAAKAFNSLLNQKKAVKTAAVVLLVFFSLYHGGRIMRGVYLSWNKSTYERVVEWSIDNLDRCDNLLAAPYIGLSLPNRTYDFYRMIFPYDRQRGHRSIEGIINLYNIRAIIFESEWKAYLTPEVQRYLKNQCRLAAKFGDFEVYLVPANRPLLNRSRQDLPRDMSIAEALKTGSQM